MDEPTTNEQPLLPTDYKLLEQEIAKEISNYEYFKSNGLVINLFKHSEGGKDSTMIKLMKADKVLYIRVFEGYTEEMRYTAYYFLYRDIFNQGLMFMNLASIEQEKLDKEKIIIEKAGEGKGTGRIIKL